MATPSTRGTCLPATREQPVPGTERWGGVQRGCGGKLPETVHQPSVETGQINHGPPKGGHCSHKKKDEGTSGQKAPGRELDGSTGHQEMPAKAAGDTAHPLAGTAGGTGAVATHLEVLTGLSLQ